MSFTVQFGTIPQEYPDGRLDAPAFHRNNAPIRDVLTSYLADENGDVIEVGSGTGQHVVTFAKISDRLRWWPSDLSVRNLASIEAWRVHAGVANVRPPIRVDVSQPDWFGNVDAPENVRAIFCANVVHIAPWAVAEGLFAGAARYLGQGGRLFLYGPFHRHGVHNSAGNEAFDRSLRQTNADWGVRDLDELDQLADANGLVREALTELPANNAILVYARK